MYNVFLEEKNYVIIFSSSNIFTKLKFGIFSEISPWKLIPTLKFGAGLRELTYYAIHVIARWSEKCKISTAVWLNKSNL